MNIDQDQELLSNKMKVSFFFPWILQS
jgi:hypothetical protein